MKKTRAILLTSPFASALAALRTERFQQRIRQSRAEVLAHPICAVFEANESDTLPDIGAPTTSW